MSGAGDCFHSEKAQIVTYAKIDNELGRSNRKNTIIPDNCTKVPPKMTKQDLDAVLMARGLRSLTNTASV